MGQSECFSECTNNMYIKTDKLCNEVRLYIYIKRDSVSIKDTYRNIR